MEIENQAPTAATTAPAEKKWWELELEMMEEQAQNKRSEVRVRIEDPKMYLINVAASCLLQEGRYYDQNDERRTIFTRALLKVAETDPEFVCQLGVYMRNELYVRTTSNYLAAFCAVNESTKPFIEKYFNAIVLLPNDLLEVCEFAQVHYIYEATGYVDLSLTERLQSNIRKELTFRNTLQRCVRNKFSLFNEYQLGKYCTDSQRKKKNFNYLAVTNVEKWREVRATRKAKLLAKIALASKPPAQKDQSDELKASLPGINKKIAKRATALKKQALKQPRIAASTLEAKYLTFKDLVRLCHITQPRDRVYKILGMKYPKTAEEFQKAFGDAAFETFNPEKAGKRMKIEVSTTWESELSQKGNLPVVWEDLIQSGQLPYMAMLRNLSNILKAGVSDITHSIIINKICEPKAVENSKMFPLQFFSAIDAVSEAITKGYKAKKAKGANLKEELERVKEITEMSEEKQADEKKKEDEAELFVKVNEDIGKRYLESLELAIKTSVNKNLDTIKGHTAIFSDVSGSMNTSISGGSKKYGSVRTCLECALVLGLMIKQRSEKSSFYIFSSPGAQVKKCYMEVDLPGDDLQPSMKKLLEKKEKLGGGTDFPYEAIDEWRANKTHVDNIVILSDMMIADGYSDIAVRGNSIVNSLKKYKEEVNPNLKIFTIDLESKGQCLNLGEEFNENNYIKIFGMSDSILKFIQTKEGNLDQVQVVRDYATAKVAPKVN